MAALALGKLRMKKSIAIDMDDTVADTLQRHISWYNNEFGVLLSKEDIRGKKIYDVVPPEHLSKVRSFPRDPSFFVIWRSLKMLSKSYLSCRAHMKFILQVRLWNILHHLTQNTNGYKNIFLL